MRACVAFLPKVGFVTWTLDVFSVSPPVTTPVVMATGFLSLIQASSTSNCRPRVSQVGWLHTMQVVVIEQSKVEHHQYAVEADILTSNFLFHLSRASHSMLEHCAFYFVS